MENTNQKQILEKLYKIMKAVERIEKDKKNTHQNYEYASEKVIKETLHNQFVENRVLMQLETQNPTILNGVTFLECTYHFIDVDSGESITGKFVGSGQARDEKGNYAAITGAIKYILTSTFLIPTGDDPENDRNEVIEPLTTAKRLVTQPAQATIPALTCDKCGAPAEEKKGTAKSGRPYHGIFCTSNDKTHTRWMYD